MASTNPRSGPVWLWILGIVVVAAIVWWIVAAMGDDAEGYATLEQEVVTLREDYTELEAEVRSLREELAAFQEGPATQEEPAGAEDGDGAGAD